MSMDNGEGLYNKHRPTTLKGIVGQDEAVLVLDKMRRTKRVPHALLITGPSGVGKTTLSLQIKEWVGCSEADGDFTHVNAADKGGIDTIRRLVETMHYKPMGDGKARMWLFDEAHKLTSEAQDTFLIPLEKHPRHCYFVLCTTDQTKLKLTVRTRCTPIDLKPIGQDHLVALVKKVAAKEGGTVSNPVAMRIAEAANGSARMALVYLEKVAPLAGDKARLRALDTMEQAGPAFDLVRALFGWGQGQTFLQPNWPAAAKVLEGIKKSGEGVEGIRQMVLSTCAGQMVKGGPSAARAAQVFRHFQYDFFQTGSTGWNGLVAASFEACITGTGGRR